MFSTFGRGLPTLGRTGDLQCVCGAKIAKRRTPDEIPYNQYTKQNLNVVQAFDAIIQEWLIYIIHTYINYYYYTITILFYFDRIVYNYASKWE